MAAGQGERWAQRGLSAWLSTDVGRSSMRAARLVPDEHEASTPGEAVAGMLRQGWGCATRPLSRPPPLCPHTPLALLVRPGGRAERCHRLPRGQTLDAVQA
jgi:hypothetical protein